MCDLICSTIVTLKESIPGSVASTTRIVWQASQELMIFLQYTIRISTSNQSLTQDYERKPLMNGVVSPLVYKLLWDFLCYNYAFTARDIDYWTDCPELYFIVSVSWWFEKFIAAWKMEALVMESLLLFSLLSFVCACVHKGFKVQLICNHLESN